MRQVSGDPCKSYKAGSTNLGVQFVGVLMMRPLLFGVYIRVPDSWKLPHGGPKGHIDLYLSHVSLGLVWDVG